MIPFLSIIQLAVPRYRWWCYQSIRSMLSKSTLSLFIPSDSSHILVKKLIVIVLHGGTSTTQFVQLRTCKIDTWDWNSTLSQLCIVLDWNVGRAKAIISTRDLWSNISKMATHHVACLRFCLLVIKKKKCLTHCNFYRMWHRSLLITSFCLSAIIYFR